MSEIVDSTADDMGTDIVPTSSAAATLFRTDDPVEVLTQASRVADALKAVMVAKGMIQRIGPSEHVKVEGWQTCGAMLGVVPVTTWTRRIDRGWEARVEARTLDGRVVGAGEAECLKDEDNWKDAEDYAVRSMAQTRATSKALSGPLRFIVTLAGFSATPAEEMDGVRRTGGGGGRPASEKQLGYLESLIKKQKVTVAGVRSLLLDVGMGLMDDEDVHVAVKRLSSQQASAAIERLKNGPVPSGESDVPSDGGEFTHPPAADPLPEREGEAA